MSLIGYALRTAKQYYKPKTYEHALRVAGYVAENNLIPHKEMDDCIALAIMHDLLEDTDYKIETWIPEYFSRCLEEITQKEGEEYIEYIKRLRSNADTLTPVYWVKIADMKDHLAQTETLTDKLKEKYLAALPYLL